MPFAAVERPSLGLGLLSATLKQQGLNNRVLYPNLEFAQRVGLARYRLLELTRNDDLVGEWVFAPAAFRQETPTAPHFWDGVDLGPASQRLGSRPELVAAFHDLRNEAEAWLESLAQRIALAPPRILGASSMFQQHCASLALLRRVKELAPQVLTILGGPNCDGDMGRATFAAFDWLDCVVCGEADDIVVPVFSQLLKAEPRPLPPGVLLRHSDGCEGQRDLIRNLDALPIPSFDDYFKALTDSPIHSQVKAGLLIESSRGCWWGQKHHCTFCGLNANGMTFRSKTGPRILEELAQLSQKYALQRFELTDNILGMERFRDLLPQLQEQSYTLFAEVKANLRREQVEALARAGVRWIQPGIENLDDQVLRLMDKGTNAAVNLQLLKWAREFGVFVSWNFLVGFPGEEDAAYTRMAQWLPNLTHLQPPQGVFKVRFDRYSPYHSEPARYGLQLKPHPSYRDVYPVAEPLLAGLAYFHVASDSDWRQGPGVTCLNEQAQRWSQDFWRASPTILSMHDDGQHLHILDTRAVAPQRRRSLEGPLRQLVLLCDQAKTLKNCEKSTGLPSSELEPLLHSLVQDRLMLALEDGRYLALPIAGELPRLLGPEDFPGGACRIGPGLQVGNGTAPKHVHP